MLTDWYQKWFDENYLLLYGHRDERDSHLQGELILKTLKPAKNIKIADLGCGAGRHVSYFHNRGYDITGFDLSKVLLAIGLEREPELKLKLHDMRSFPGNYDLVLSLFTSFGYFQEGENEKLVKHIAGSLNPGGCFWLDFLNKNNLNISPDNRSATVINGTKVEEHRYVREDRVIKEIIFHTDNGEKKYFESVRLYSRQELESLLAAHGFTVEHVFGGYSGAAWQESSERTILVARLG